MEAHIETVWTEEKRRDALAAETKKQVKKGWRVESQGDFQVALVKGHRPNHLLHLVLTVLTVGVWLLVWAIVTVTSGEKRKVLAIDADGKITD